MRHGTHIELFLVDGEAGGITTADIASWTGHLLVGPRSRLSELLARDEARRNGAYLLLGEDPEAVEHTRCYIGKTENFIERFRDHDHKKDWWERAVLISSSDDSFNEGHWGYIESRLVAIARQAERSTLDENRQTPQPRKPSEAQRSDAESFIERVRTVLPVLGVLVLKTLASHQHSTVGTAVETPESPVFFLGVQGSHVAAQAQVIGGEFVLLKGSTVAGQWRGKARTASTQLCACATSSPPSTTSSPTTSCPPGSTSTITTDPTQPATTSHPSPA